MHPTLLGARYVASPIPLRCCTLRSNSHKPIIYGILTLYGISPFLRSLDYHKMTIFLKNHLYGKILTLRDPYIERHYKD